MNECTVPCVVETLEGLLHSTGNGHGGRVEQLAVEIGRRLNGGVRLEAIDIENLGYAARLHDFGKLFVPTEILSKRFALDASERGVMQEHCQRGLDATESLNLPAGVRLTMLYHHERFDGHGYPRGISGDDIPLFARIVSICDVWDALNSHRPYRRAFPRRVAVVQMEKMESAFDPRILSVFWKVIDDIQ